VTRKATVRRCVRLQEVADNRSRRGHADLISAAATGPLTSYVEERRLGRPITQSVDSLFGGTRGHMRTPRPAGLFGALLACLCLFVLAGACGGHGPATAPPSQASDVGATAIVAAMHKHYGSLLDTVQVARVWLPESADSSAQSDGLVAPGLQGRWAYQGVYRLNNLPLRFAFTVERQPGDTAAIPRDSAYNDRALLHDDIGGVWRFALLAARYHKDFPQEPTMAYWPASDNGVSKQEPYVTLLRGHRGIAVVVYKFDDYWGDGQAPSLGLYWWSGAQRDWVLLHRGSLPDLR
jgi:hypothetical protein